MKPSHLALDRNHRPLHATPKATMSLFLNPLRSPAIFSTRSDRSAGVSTTRRRLLIQSFSDFAKRGRKNCFLVGGERVQNAVKVRNRGLVPVRKWMRRLVRFHCMKRKKRESVSLLREGFMKYCLVKRHCFPVYWDGENRRVLRGNWFARKGVDWLPLREYFLIFLSTRR
ncbi:uncharacterized protein LOC133713375 [Rosa rugosa]|uniref:uncharacterized protein LOC133713375 n=1 Tax=Rosa rugosa TaxID=74645 RepID=UPI002B40CFE5|nr:uncharacterized protein LOC133713375 [Rosa rugosa]